LPINQSGLIAIEKLQQHTREKLRVKEENAAAREQESRTLDDVKSTFQTWLNAELEMAAAHISDSGVLTCTVGDPSFPENWHASPAHNSIYRPVFGLELRFRRPEDAQQHFLQIRLCEYISPVITVTVNIVGHAKEKPPEVVPARDPQLALIPYYCQRGSDQQSNNAGLKGFLTDPKAIGTTRPKVTAAQPRQRQPIVADSRGEGLTQGFHTDITLHHKFRASEWPGNATSLRESLTCAISAFLEYIAGGAKRISA